MAKGLTQRTLDSATGNRGRTVATRRLYWNGRRVKNTFTFERAERGVTGFVSHHVTLFGHEKEIAVFIFDRHANVYVDADDGTIFDSLRNAIQDKLIEHHYLEE